MIEKVAEAFKQQDYRTAGQLLKQLAQKTPQDPWVRFYIGRLHEVSGRVEAAEKVYRGLLKSAPMPKLMKQARQGLQRLENLETERRQRAIAAAKADPTFTEPGCLVLEPLQGDARIEAGKQFARIMKLDAYTARMQLPSRGWRFYRVGAIGELRVYGQELSAAGIPNFCVPFSQVHQIPVFRIHHFEAVSPQAAVICQNDLDQMGSLQFDWSEVSQMVEGMVPIFEMVVDKNARHQLERKEKTLDYAQLCDLHLPSRGCILRICDGNYEFQNGVLFEQASSLALGSPQATTRQRWNSLSTFLKQQLPNAVMWSNFTDFAETAVEQMPLIGKIKSHIDLFRRSETDWDPAFQLYSSLAYAKGTSASSPVPCP